jgi:hypothetical protein
MSILRRIQSGDQGNPQNGQQQGNNAAGGNQPMQQNAGINLRFSKTLALTLPTHCNHNVGSFQIQDRPVRILIKT